MLIGKRVDEIEQDSDILKRSLLYKSSAKDSRIYDISQKYVPSQYRTNGWLEAISIIVQKMSEIPWYTQQEILDETGLNKAELIELNDAIRGSDFLQNLIVNEGLGRKGWSTILPLIQTGAVDNAINFKYNFPVRLGIYPGKSCMFYCGFCGRNETASYPKNAIEEGNAIFKRIFASMPTYSTISISGGLEPLTNLGIGDLISAAKSHGIRVPLITNGYMLTPKYIEKQPGIWNTDSLRISLYGVDEDSYYYVTRKKGAYQLVKENVIEFLKARNKIKSDLQVGLNYVLIPENIDHLSRLLDNIIEINSMVDGQGINFLTLREDFGSVTSAGEDDINKKYKLEGLLLEKERGILIDKFKEFNHRREEFCPELNIDFGYALVALADGVLGKPLARVEGSQMRPWAYPQISVAIDSYGDVFLYREAGFLDRPGNNKFIAGRVTNTRLLEDILQEFIECRRQIELDSSDARFMDAFDHLVTLLLNQAESDRKIGIPFELGPVRMRHYDSQIVKTKNKALFGTFHQ